MIRKDITNWHSVASLAKHTELMKLKLQTACKALYGKRCCHYTKFANWSVTGMPAIFPALSLIIWVQPRKVEKNTLLTPSIEEEMIYCFSR